MQSPTLPQKMQSISRNICFFGKQCVRQSIGSQLVKNRTALEPVFPVNELVLLVSSKIYNLNHRPKKNPTQCMLIFLLSKVIFDIRIANWTITSTVIVKYGIPLANMIPHTFSSYKFTLWGKRHNSRLMSTLYRKQMPFPRSTPHMTTSRHRPIRNSNPILPT